MPPFAQPQRAELARVGRRHRQIEAAIAVENGRRGTLHRFRPRHEIGNLRAVLRRRFELLDGEVRGIETCRRRFDGDELVVARIRIERHGRQEILEAELRLGPVIVGRGDVNRTAWRQRQRRVRPCVARGIETEGADLSHDILVNGGVHGIAPDGNFFDRCARAGRIEHVDLRRRVSWARQRAHPWARCRLSSLRAAWRSSRRHARPAAPHPAADRLWSSCRRD